MKKLFTLFITLTAAVSAFALETVKVTVLMNATATHFEIVPLENQTTATVTEVITREYELEVVPGTVYQLKTYNKNEVWLGSINLKFDFEDAENPINIFTPSVKIKNSGWVLDTDGTFDVALEKADCTPREIEISKELGYITFPAVKSDVYNVTGQPSAARKSEGYLSCFTSGPVTFNRTLSMSFPMGYEYTLTIPTGAETFVGTKLRHYSPFAEIAPSKTTDNGNGTTSNTYVLGEKEVYNYRVKHVDAASGKNYTTIAEKFAMPAENTQKEITRDFLTSIPDPKTVVIDPAENKGYNVSDLFVNADYRGVISMKSGDSRQIVNVRNWQITDNLTNNYFFEPDYHYAVVGLDGKPSSDVITVDENGVITAKGKGAALVLVTYDALYSESQIGGPFFGAIEPENTGLIVVTVDGGSMVRPNTFINETLNADYFSQRLCDVKIDAELDVLYFDEEAATYKFTPEKVDDVQLASPTFTSGSAEYTGFSHTGVIKNDDGSYTLTLPAGRNIVQMTDADGRNAYQVIRARKCTFDITNNTNPGDEPAPGDEVAVTVNGIYHPANKLAAVYNMNATVQYSTPSGETVKGKPNQYQFASNSDARTVTVTIPSDWDTEKDFALTDGAILCSNYGDLYGSHRYINYEQGRNANFTSELRTAYFGALPSVTLYKAKGDPDGIENVTVEAQDNPANNAIYDLTGRRLERVSAPGFYIIGGKKVMVK